MLAAMTEMVTVVVMLNRHEIKLKLSASNGLGRRYTQDNNQAFYFGFSYFFNFVVCGLQAYNETRTFLSLPVHCCSGPSRCFYIVCAVIEGIVV